MKKYIPSLVILFFTLISCENNIQGPADTTNPPDAGMRATFSSIQDQLFSPTCATAGCHGGTQSPNLSAGKAYNNLVNVSSLENPTLLRVKPNDSENSFLIRKLRGQNTTRMPLGGSQLSAAIIDSVVVWINKGALNN